MFCAMGYFRPRVTDQIIAGLSLVVLAPIIMCAMGAIALTSPGPVVLKQARVGYGRRIFYMYKLRTMSMKPERVFRQSFSGDPDVTPVGRILRRFKIDELPQLINVVWGDMALVGPRPYLPCVSATLPTAAIPRWDVRPGLTGWAQVNGNIYLDATTRWQLDLDYVQHRTWLLDLWIIAKTILVLVLGEDTFVRRPSHLFRSNAKTMCTSRPDQIHFRTPKPHALW